MSAVRTEKKTATLDGKIVAESNTAIYFDNQWYFPRDSVKEGVLKGNGKTGHCGWKGEYDWFDVSIDGSSAPGSAWIYPKPMAAATVIAGRVGFWNKVKVA